VYFEFNDALFFEETIGTLRATFDAMLDAIGANPHIANRELLTLPLRAD
jgi:hypothetical protein